MAQELGAADAAAHAVSNLALSREAVEVLPDPLQSIATKTDSCTVDGKNIDIVTMAFIDSIFVSVTHGEGGGAVMLCENFSAPEGEPTFDVSVLLGDREDEQLILLGRALVEKVCASTDKKLLFLCSLRSPSAEVMHSILANIEKARVW